MTRKILVLVLTLVAVSCAPKDEKVSTGGARGGQQQNDQDLPSGFPERNDRTPEYTAAMLFEVAEVAREIETVALAVEALNAPPNAAAPAALVAPSCVKTTNLNSAAGTMKRINSYEDCKETSVAYAANQRGTENVLAVITGNDGAKRASVVRVSTQGMAKSLTPVANKKDSLELKQFRFLDADLVSDQSGVLTYKVSYTSDSRYFVNLKAFTDDGSVFSNVRGYVDFDLAQKRVVRFWTDADNARVSVLVKSGRTPRGGHNTLHQEFYGSGQPAELVLNLAGCVAPTGEFKTRFSIKSFGRDVQAATEGGKKYFLDKESEVKTTANGIGVLSGSSPVKVSVCAIDGSFPVSEGVQGLLY